VSAEPVAPVTRASRVRLREITEATLGAFLQLQVTADQNRFVASNAVSIAQAHFSPLAWFRGIYADETPVGFVMLSDDPAKPEYFLWRFMIDARFQRMGFGRQAIALIVAHVKTRPRATQLLASCVEGDGTPIPFYESLGFRRTGAVEDGEAVIALQL
jgi:diamine N-acetyltransferase